MGGTWCTNWEFMYLAGYSLEIGQQVTLVLKWVN